MTEAVAAAPGVGEAAVEAAVEAEAEVEELEINFRLDENGRTALSTPESESESESESSLQKLQLQQSRSLLEQHFYSTQTVMTDLASATLHDHDKFNIDDLLLDCQISDSCLMPRTFWVAAAASSACPEHQQRPRFTLEQFALDIFNYHTSKLTCRGVQFEWDPVKSGAEWWCQIKPSPDGGRYSAVANAVADAASASANDTTDNDSDNDNDDNGISFHVDKDEDLRILTGGHTYICPHVSTVTYLTDKGKEEGNPTVVLDGIRVHPLEGSWIVPTTTTTTTDTTTDTDTDTDTGADDDGDNDTNDNDNNTQNEIKMFVSSPLRGKHLSFDGRMLHGAPSMSKLSMFDEEEDEEDKDKDKIKQQQQQQQQQEKNINQLQLDRRRQRRVTFLVNIWLNYKPYNVHPFPDSMASKMSGYCQRNAGGEGGNGEGEGGGEGEGSTTSTSSTQVMRSLTFLSSKENDDCTTPKTHTTSAVKVTDNNGNDNDNYHSCCWPLGDQRSGENLHVRMPRTMPQITKSTAGNATADNTTATASAAKGDNVCIVYPKGTFRTLRIDPPTDVDATNNTITTATAATSDDRAGLLCLTSPNIYGHNENDHDHDDDGGGDGDGGDNDDNNDDHTKNTSDSNNGGDNGTTTTTAEPDSASASASALASEIADDNNDHDDDNGTTKSLSPSSSISAKRQRKE